MNSLPPSLSPPTRDVGHMTLMPMDFGWACGCIWVWGRYVGNDKGDPWFGRPVRYAGRWTTVGSPPFTYFNHCCLLKLKHIRIQIFNVQCSHYTHFSHLYPPPNPSHPLACVPAQTNPPHLLVCQHRHLQPQDFSWCVLQWGGWCATSLDLPNRLNNDDVSMSSTTNEDMTTTMRLHQVPVMSQPDFSPSIFPTPLMTCNNDVKESMMSWVGTNDTNVHLSLTLSHSYDYLNLTRPHSSVNWHSHCSCKVYRSFCIGYPPTGLHTHGFLKTLTLTHQNPYPWWRVQVCWGKGMGSPGKPQGYLWQSLILNLFWNSPNVIQRNFKEVGQHWRLRVSIGKCKESAKKVGKSNMYFVG